MDLKNAPLDIEQIFSGHKAAVARALNLVENRHPDSSVAVRELTDALSRQARHQRHLIGISGPPGVGKSSMISCLIEKYRAQNKTIGILSVDPSSRKSGGALLGDRIRIQYDPTDAGVFIRSMAAGQHLGGLSWNTRLNLMVYETVYDIIILETVGVGQSETEIENVVDTVVVVAQPGSGDLLQFMKAGIMEIPNVLVINKADQEELAAKTFNDLKHAAMFDGSDHQGWQMDVIMTSALRGSGFDQLVSALQRHREHLENTGIVEKRQRNLYGWVVSFFKERFGSFGVERLGGEDHILEILKQSGIVNPLIGMQLLAELMKQKR
jgi:LAO/AO transport system kinase